MVYAVVSETVRRFKFALGRPLRWRTKRFAGKDDPLRDRLRIFPHAFEQANAFYDAEIAIFESQEYLAAEARLRRHLPELIPPMPRTEPRIELER
jgi:hypothetical protein